MNVKLVSIVFASSSIIRFMTCPFKTTITSVLLVLYCCSNGVVEFSLVS